ncbi:ribonuclease H-like domain-containing protein [Tanacetum coccineum]
MSETQDENPPPPPPPATQQTPTQQTPHTVSTIKLPILKKGEYDIWAMKMEHYLAHTRLSNLREEMVLRERERRARTTLLMAIPEDHLAKFHKMTDAKDMWNAIKSRFGGNDESKKMQKYILKQQFEGFTVSNSDGIHKGYERFQSLLSQLEIHGAGVSTEDANQKFLRSLPSAWLQVSLIMRNKPGMDSLSFDDLYNNLRVFENDVKGSTASSSNLQNIAFVSENTNSTNEVSTAYGVSHSSGHCLKHEQPSTSSYSLLASQSSCPQLDHEDLDQVDEYDLEEMDLKWQVAMISMRINKFQKKTGRKLQFDAKEPVGFDKTKVECFKCHKTGHFARECRTKEENRRRDGWNTGNREGRRTSNRDESITGKKEESRALVTVDGECVDWTTHSEDNDNYAFMANNSTGSDTQVLSCSNECKESYANIKRLYDIQKEQLSDASVEIKAYTQGLKKVEAQEQLSDASLEIKAYTQGLKKVEAQLVAHQQGQHCDDRDLMGIGGYGDYRYSVWLREGYDDIMKRVAMDVYPQYGCSIRIHVYSNISTEPSELVSEPVVNESIVESINTQFLVSQMLALRTSAHLQRKGPSWLFDLDYLTDSMNYHSVRSENQANLHAGQQESNQNTGTKDKIDAGDSEKEDESAQDCFELPIWHSYSSTNPFASKSDNKIGGPREEEQVFLDDLARLQRQEKEANEEAEALRKNLEQETENLVTQAGAAKSSGTNIFSTVSTTAKASGTNLVNTVSIPVSTASPNEGLSTSDTTNSQEDDSEIPPLEDIHEDTTDGIFTHSSYDDEGAEADFTNLETVMNVSPYSHLKNKSTSHPSAHISRDPTSAYNKSKVYKSSEAHAYYFNHLEDEGGSWLMQSKGGGIGLQVENQKFGFQELITWQCKKQTIVATSTTEAEYVAAASCCGQVLWIQNQMLDYGFNFMNTKIYIDNESTICIVKNPVYHSKTKYIAIRHRFIRDAYEKNSYKSLNPHR